MFRSPYAWYHAKRWHALLRSRFSFPWQCGHWCVLAFILLGLLSQFGSAASEANDPSTIVERMATAYNGIKDYTALFLKQERVDGKLKPMEKIELRFQEPFKVYMGWYEPYAGRAIAYIEDENDNKIHVNPGGMLKLMRLSLAPTGYLATRNDHHSILQAGIRNTIKMIVQQYQRGKAHDQVIVHLQGNEAVDGRPTYHLEFIYPPDKKAGYYAYRAEVWIDKEFYLPTKLRIYDWGNQLYEYYEYRSLQLNPGLAPDAFRLASPESKQQPEPKQLGDSSS